jgi:hypothetical protein
MSPRTSLSTLPRRAVRVRRAFAADHAIVTLLVENASELTGAQRRARLEDVLGHSRLAAADHFSALELGEIRRPPRWLLRHRHDVRDRGSTNENAYAPSASDMVDERRELVLHVGQFGYAHMANLARWPTLVKPWRARRTG